MEVTWNWEQRVGGRRGQAEGKAPLPPTPKDKTKPTFLYAKNQEVKEPLSEWQHKVTLRKNRYFGQSIIKLIQGC